MRSLAFAVLPIFCVVLLAVPGVASAQQGPGREPMREGLYELTLKTTDSRTISVPEIYRDRDLDPKAIFRVTTGGYLAFDEDDWIDKIEFKVFDIPATDMPGYKKYRDMLVLINKRIFEIKMTLRNYDEMALRLMNICDRQKFQTFSEIDQNIIQQLSVYKNLILLRSLVINSLNRFIRDRSCVDRYAKYSNDLKRYTDRLTELCKNYQALRRKALATALPRKASLHEPRALSGQGMR